MKFEDIIDEYLIFIKLKRKDNTYESIERRIEKHITPFFKDYKIEDISIKDYLKWQNYIDNKGFKFNYKSSLHYTMSGIFDYAYKMYGIKKIPNLVGNFKNTQPSDNGNIWTLEEFNRFLEVISDKKDYIMFKLLYFTGMRKGELLALTWNDIDFINKTVNINKTITRKHNIHNPKSESSNRIIYLPDSLMNELKKIKTDDQLIFDISFTTLKRKKDNYCELSGVKQIKIHEFRHSHAVLLYKNDIPIDEISNRLGHSKISITTDIYLKYIPKQQKRVLSFLNTLN